MVITENSNEKLIEIKLGIDYKESAAVLIMNMVGFKKSYPVKENMNSDSTLHFSNLLEQFYADADLELPPNGFKIFILDNSYFAIPN